MHDPQQDSPETVDLQEPPLRQRDVLEVLLHAALGVTMIVLFSIADRAVLFEYFPLWLTAILPLLLLAAGIPGRGAGLKAAVLLLVAIWLLLLPHVRWNDLKGFYVDCHSIGRGDSRESVYATMSDYLANAEASEEADTVIFTPSLERSADLCVVEFRGDRVRNTYAHPD